MSLQLVPSDKRYTWIGSGSRSTTCPTCWATVNTDDQAGHNQWHAKLLAVEARAHVAEVALVRRNVEGVFWLLTILALWTWFGYWLLG